ncbi:cupin domain-containing protein [Corynebacterium sp. TAE3-ERU12]|uniref:cupin domain-containing protein n=1 Tax=Corynebacterium sp. TAE3-ERU12 TaxID=2849491 RepID=UPI001C442A7F|nr:cupin domain-containing protein [Corynebacterium sp. TAE3-ERU12]MBV7295212.1 cupin domain-containing protein [Corynebacterium sp. TAE3-ERU12]
MSHTEPTPSAVFDALALAPEAKDGAFPAAQRLGTCNGVTLIVFRFAPGQHMTEHRAPHPITVQVLTGAVDFTVGEHTAHLTAGTIQYVDEHLPHSLTSPEGAVMLLMLHTGAQ